MIQQIQPVIEQTHTVIAKGEPRPQVAPLGINDLGSGGGSSGGGSAGGFSAARSNSASSGISAGSAFGGQLRTSDYAAAASSPASSSTSQMTVKSVPESVIRIHKPSLPSQGSSASASTHAQSSTSQAAPSGRDQASKFPASIQQLFQQHSSNQVQHDQHQPDHKPSRQYHQGSQQQQQYSNRQGEIPRKMQYTPAKMTLKPAPVVRYLPIDQQYQRRSARYIQPRVQPAYAAYQSAYELSPEEMQLLSFVAQPVRFRARA